MVPVWPPAAAGEEHGFPIGLAPYWTAPCRWLRGTRALQAALGICIQATELSSRFLLQFELNCCSGTIQWISMDGNDSLDK